MKRNKVFSFALMIEGIKQTKVIGICFAIISILVSCSYPLLRLISYASMDYEMLKAQPDFTIGFGTFSMTIFVIQYIMPIIMVFLLFSFMNKRNASDFYHSIPLSKTCVYFTYTAAALIWSIVTVVVSTLLSYTIYALSLKTVINASFILPTIISSIILAMLITSIALIAKGLSGTYFTNIIITIMIMFLPRIIILLYATAVNTAVKITDVSFMSLTDIYNNIIFAPFVSIDRTLPLLDSMTLWYSAILAVIYFVIAFVIHKFRKSESAGKSAAYKGVQPVVRIILGSIPLLLISYNFACGLDVIIEFWLIGIVVSLLAYFLYELITTRSAKKLLTAMPFYLIAILANAIFIVACIGERNFILNDIPQASDISSVSLSTSYYYENNWYEDNYYKYKTENIKFDDKELIEILQASLVDTVEKVKENNLDRLNNDNYISYNVIIHCSSGRDIKRTICVNMNKYKDINNPSSSILDSYILKNQEYMNAVYSLPTDKEIRSVSIDTSNDYFSQNELNELWKTYKEEYNAASNKEKDILNYRNDNENGITEIADIFVTGYVGINDFSQHYLIDIDITPKTYSKVIKKIMSNHIENNIADKVKKNVDNAECFRMDFLDLKDSDNYFYLQYFNDNVELKFMTNPSVYGALKRYDVIYDDSSIDEKYTPELRKVANIIINAMSADVSIEKGNLIRCILTTDVDFEYSYDDGINGYYDNSISELFYVNITDEQYDEINSILNKCSKHTKYTEAEN